MVNCATLQAAPDNIHTRVETSSKKKGESIDKGMEINVHAWSANLTLNQNQPKMKDI